MAVMMVIAVEEHRKRQQADGTARIRISWIWLTVIMVAVIAKQDS